ncbi:MAG: PLP-dependent aspartate aminotransferase family protein [Bryobacterales bacterium]
MKLPTLAVHAGDRKKPGDYIPVTTPIHGAASYVYEDIEDLDRVFGGERPGMMYGRYGNPTVEALEEQIAALEGGDFAIATSSGMAAIHLALQAALLDRRKSIVAAKVLYGQTLTLLMSVLEPGGIEVEFADPCDLQAFEATIAEAKPAVVLVETVSNPLLRVSPLDRIAEIAHAHGALVIVDASFTSPALLQPLSLGIDIVVHSATKYLAGHGDVLGGILITREEFRPALRVLSRSLGPNMGPFEAYLTMRGVKTLPLRVERQCQNACRVAAWLKDHPRIDRVYFPGDPAHPDHDTVKRLFANGSGGAMVSFELKDAGREQIFAFLNALKIVVRATSLGDVHSMILHPVMSSHRDLAPRHRERLGIRDNLLRLSVGIEAVEDIVEDLDQALAESA